MRAAAAAPSRVDAERLSASSTGAEMNADPRQQTVSHSTDFPVAQRRASMRPHTMPAAASLCALALLIAVTAARPASAQTLGGCDGEARQIQHSTSSTDGGRKRLTVQWSGDDCSVELHARGEFELNADLTDIARLGP